MPMIYGTNSLKYQSLRGSINTGQYNGAYYYAKEIEDIIIPRVKTERSWVTINTHEACDGAIVFIHSNVDLEKHYGFLSKYKDLILVCSNVETQKYMTKFGTSVFLPLSIDVPYVRQFRVEKKTEDACYAGNMWSFKNQDLAMLVPPETHCFINMPREHLLRNMAKYKKCYAVGRTAIEAKLLGCQLMVCDSRYPNTRFWQIIDSRDSAKTLQRLLDLIDK